MIRMEGLDQTQLGGGIAAAITAVVSAIFFLRKKISSDNVDIKRDRAEENIIDHLERQRDHAFLEIEKMQARLDALKIEKDDAVSKMSGLTSEVEILSGQVRILNDLVERLGISLNKTQDNLQRYILENSRLLDMLEASNERDRRSEDDN